ncbi:kinase-like domain-containing protein [Chytridium lagenaria]|nr:kinase-like domain-containing protein [Chytridium lagenaria]
MDKGIHKTLKAMNITNAKSISKEHVNNYSLIHSGRHIVEHCEYSDGDFSVPCVFKYVNTGMNRYIGHQQVYDIGTEVAALTALGMHPYFPKLFGKFERDPNSVGILMEYVGENGQQPLSLREYLTNNIVEWSERLRFMRQIVSAVAYMHKSGIVHCGLNSGDILIRNDPEFGSYIKLMDFDRAIIVAADTANPISDVHSRILEHPYFAPEIHNGGFPSYTTDIFAVGTLLWELAYCTIPFDHVHPEAVAGLICSGERDGLPSGSHNGAPPELVKELDDATFDIYRCDVAAFGQADNPPTTLKEWREEYLSLRGGLSCEDLYCVRVLSGFWFDRKLPSTYLPSDPSARKSQAMKWLQHAADRYGNGGAAYELGKEIFGGMNNPDGRQWLTKAKEYGHPPSIKLVTYHQYKVEKVLSKKEYEVVGAKMLYLCTVRDALAEQRRQQREGLF